MAPLLDQLLWPQRVLEGLLKEIGRFATAAERVARSSEEIAFTFKSIERHLASIDDSFEHDLPARLERLHEAFDRSNEEIESFRDVMRPIVPEIAMTREAVQAADV